MIQLLQAIRMMLTHLTTLALAALLVLMPFQQSLALESSSENNFSSENTELPSALSEDDSFNDLPFEQLRQALREEVEQNPEKRRLAPSPQKYNLLIR